MSRPRIYDHDAVLTRWQRGETEHAIAAVLDIPRGSVSTIIFQARRRGDPRAVRRLPARSGPDVPGWVIVAGLRDDFCDVALEHGEEAAAAYCRALKRQIETA